MTTIEKIARALDPYAFSDIGRADSIGEYTIQARRRELAKKHAFSLAIAAVKAIREASVETAGAMSVIAIEGPDHDYFYPSLADCESLFVAAIDSILTEAEGEGK